MILVDGEMVPESSLSVSLDSTQESEPLPASVSAEVSAALADLPAPAAAEVLTRQERARRACVNIGIGWPDTILPEGTALWESGEQRLRADREAWMRLPLAKDALPVVSEALAAEDRRDDVVRVRDLRLDYETSRITFARAGSLGADVVDAGYSKHAFRQLTAQVPDLADAPRGVANVLLHLTARERAQIVNARIPTAEPTITLRTRMTHNGQRVARAVLSERYASVTDLDIASAIGPALNGDAAISRLDYKPGDDQSRFEIFWPSDIPVKTFRVGDVHRAIVQVRNSETGQGSIEIVPGVIRAACANLTLVHGEGVRVSIRHLGDRERVHGSMRAALRQAMAQIEPLIVSIQRAATTILPEGDSPSSMLARIAETFNVGEDRAGAWASTYNRGYAAQEGRNPTLWGITSAITEAAQGASWWGAQQEEEEIAAKLVHVSWKAVKK